MIFDEVTSGFRVNCGGIHLRLGVQPDIAVFAKGISNGYAMAAIIGRGDVMQSAQRSFISSTNWTERLGPAAALATIRKHRKLDVGSRLIEIGATVQRAWREAAKRAGLDINVSGLEPLSHIEFKVDNAQALSTLYTQMMLDQGFLAGKAFYASFAHTADHIHEFQRALDVVFPELINSIANRSVERELRGPVAHAGFQRLT